ncbi:hypothetical protein [Mesorhizobium sp.]|uniref:hypothetical protein n=1 Tax=Mesorhizobium sp. TaxID=1871066 RepID=UPI00120F6D4F|nr:hypothetical protein [Mesorhizobium sp.]TIO29640.1 MAG: hypothetical protein E5X89_30115 [Mesorhizobium sp.]
MSGSHGARAFLGLKPPAALARPVNQIQAQGPKMAAILDDAEPDVLAYMTVPNEHRAKFHSWV